MVDVTMASIPLLETEDILPFRAVFENGLPSVTALDSVLATVEYQLETNSRQLDECLQAVLHFTNDLPGNKCFTAPQDTLKYMISSHVLEKNSCYDLETEDIIKILRHVQNALEKYPGGEELIMEDLLSLSASEGISLPLRTGGVTVTANSVASLNTLVDSNDQMIEQLWEQISLHLRRYFIEKLSKLPVRGFEQELNLQEHKRLEYLQNLVTLFQPEVVLGQYHALRVQQIEQCFNSLLPQPLDEQLDVGAITKNCNTLAGIIVGMIDEDFAIFTTGIFKKASSTFRAIRDLYLDKYSDEMSALIEEIYDDLKEAAHKKPTQSSSEFVLDVNHKKPLLKGYAQSVDNIFNPVKKSNRKASLIISRQYLHSLHDILLSVLQIEEHVDYLYEMVTLDAGGINTKKPRFKGSLRGVLKAHSPEILRRTGSQSSNDSSIVLSESSNTPIQPSPLLGSRAAPKVIEKMKVEERPHWDWKLIFKMVGPELAHCVDQVVRGCATSLLDREQKMWTDSCSLDTVNVKEELCGGRLDYPKCVSVYIMKIMEDLDVLLPFAKAGNDGILHPVRAAFVDSTNLLMKNIHVFLMKASGDIPNKAPIKYLYVMMSNAVYIRNHLMHYDDIIADIGKKHFSVLYGQFAELVNVLSNQVVDINNQIISNLLHDSESNHWSDEKEFYEEERCSFSVQMWQHYLKGIQYDLWTICPSKLAQNLFGRILNDSLGILARRYTRVKPTFRRVSQLRVDILTILLCTCELLPATSDSVSKYLDPGYCHQPQYSIHNLCSSLLATLAVVTSPLDTLYRFCKKMFRVHIDHGGDQNWAVAENTRSFNTRWLSWMEPCLFQEPHRDYDSFQTTVAIYLHTKLLSSQPEPNWPMVVQALILKDYTLPILFMTQSFLGQDRDSLNDEQNENRAMVQRLFFAMAEILVHQMHFTDALGKILLPVIERSEQWYILDLTQTSGALPPAPIWLEMMFYLLKPFIHRVLKPVLKKLLNQPNTAKEIESVMSVFQNLPCGCIPQSMAAFRTKRQQGSARDQVKTSVLEVVKQLEEEIYTLPAPICAMFLILQDVALENNVQLAHGCLGLQVIAMCLKKHLWGGTYIESLSGTLFSPETKDTLNILADGVYNVILSNSGADYLGPEACSSFFSRHQDWVSRKIKNILNFLNAEISEQSSLPETITSEFNDQLFTVISNNIMDSQAGHQSLQDIYNLILNNEAWLRTQLDIKTSLSYQSGEQCPSFILDFSPRKIGSFDPIESFCHVGVGVLDHEAIQNFQFEWLNLLQSDLGVSIYGLRTLVENRCEMQDGVFLEDSEKKLVEGLKSLFEYDAGDLG